MEPLDTEEMVWQLIFELGAFDSADKAQRPLIVDRLADAVERAGLPMVAAEIRDARCDLDRVQQIIERVTRETTR